MHACVRDEKVEEENHQFLVSLLLCQIGLLCCSCSGRLVNYWLHHDQYRQPEEKERNGETYAIEEEID
ncbi:hypothetical protein T01_12187 [Trichinella spiralis]|uniref:Uncharacterized protein n=1 Tax=Trichinella spiralis TaxID=6334 RepID=A0A0V1BVE0_TRISP|nr:hypothetical protein T01_12187 [Trichinella spiralis]